MHINPGKRVRPGLRRGVGAPGQETEGAGAGDVRAAARLDAGVEPDQAVGADGQSGRDEPDARDAELAGGGLRALSKIHGSAGRGANELSLAAGCMSHLTLFCKSVLLNYSSRFFDGSI